jgi:excisionase family DNA binding protein
LSIERPRLLSVTEAAAELNSSDAYVRRLLLRQRIYAVKVGIVWAIFPADLEAFKRMRRPPGRPRKLQESTSDIASAALIASERKGAGTKQFLRKRTTKSAKPKQRRSAGG